MAPKAILFDLDETLTDRSKSLMKYSKAFIQNFTSYLSTHSVEKVYPLLKAADGDGYRPREEFYTQLVKELPWAVKLPDASSISVNWFSVFPLCSVATTGMYEVLDNLKSSGILLGIITNGGTISQNRKIDALGIRKYLDTIIISESVHVQKPDPEIFALALEEIKVSASDTWFIGDHPTNDIIGSLSAGLTPVWIRGIHPWLEGCEEPLKKIDSIIQLESLIKLNP